MSRDLDDTLERMQALVESGAFASLEGCRESLDNIGDALADLVDLAEKSRSAKPLDAAQIAKALATALQSAKAAVINVPPAQVTVQVAPARTDHQIVVQPSPVVFQPNPGAVVHHVDIEYSRGLPVRMTITRKPEGAS